MDGMETFVAGAKVAFYKTRRIEDAFETGQCVLYPAPHRCNIRRKIIILMSAEENRVT